MTRAGTPTARTKYRVPREFRPARDLPAGRYPLLEVFRGLSETPAFRKYPGDDREIRAIARSSWVSVSDGRGWMYVAPRTVPAEIRAAGFEMITSAEEEIVVARKHLSRSRTLDLYLDIIHEFLHILQRRHGRELWPGLKVPYVDRHTEIEAYAFSVAEARRLGVPDSYLRRYLEVFWLTPPDYLRLLTNLGVRPPTKRARARRSPKPLR